MPAYKTKKQVAYLLSDASPLTAEEKKRLKKELHEGKVKIRVKARGN